MSRKHIRVVGAMLEKGSGRYLITQRRPTASLPLLWEFPGGRVKDGETDEAALLRAIKERLGLEVVVVGRASSMTHGYPEYDVDFSVLHCRLADTSQEVSRAKVNDARWVTVAEMKDYKFPDADARSLEFLLESDG